jgi:hypothetical protein
MFEENCSMIHLQKSDFHKMNQKLTSIDKKFEVQICSQSFFFSKEQIILLSVEAYLQFLGTNNPFSLMSPLNLSNQQLISSFYEIYLLFPSSHEIQINHSDVQYFQYLAEKFKMLYLLSIYQNGIQTNQSQTFFFSSKAFTALPKHHIESLNNIQIILGSETIDCNFIFASLISHKISKHICRVKSLNFIDFSDYHSPQTIKLFFEILKGNSLQVN